MTNASSLDMRLRQIAFAAHDLDAVLDQLDAAFGLRAGYEDPAIIHYGLRNIVIPIGGEFLEIVQPVQEGSSAGRYLARRGGDSGYMVILQAEDALTHRARMSAAGVQIVDVIDHEEHQCSHFHPREFGGVLASIDAAPGVADWREADSFWHPAGHDWQRFKTGLVQGIASVTIASVDPAENAARWGRMLNVQPRQSDGALCIDLLRGAAIRFVPLGPEGPSGIVGMDVLAADPDVILSRARAAGLNMDGDAVTICNVTIHVKRAC